MNIVLMNSTADDVVFQIETKSTRKQNPKISRREEPPKHQIPNPYISRRDDPPTTSSSVSSEEAYSMHDILGLRTFPPRYENERELLGRSLRLPSITQN